jgi:hypothetical protein
MTPPTRLVVLVVLALVAAACSAGEEPSEAVESDAASERAAGSESVEPSESPAASGSAAAGGEMISVFDLVVGDCFNAPEGDIVSEVERLDCDDPHTYEAYHSVDHPATSTEAWIGDEAMTEFAEEACLGAFEDFVGTPYEESELFYFYLQPTAETWDVGDREILCSVYLEEGDLTESMEGSGR